MTELAKLATSFQMKADSGDGRGLSHTPGGVQHAVCAVHVCCCVRLTLTCAVSGTVVAVVDCRHW